MPDRSNAQAHVGMVAVAVMDTLDNDEILIALGRVTQAVDEAARLLEEAGHDPTQAAVLITGLCLRSWRMETKPDD